MHKAAASNTTGTPASFLFPCRKGAGQPIDSFVQTITSCGTSGLDEPVTVAQSIQAELFCDLSCWHCVRQILFVRKHQSNSISHFMLVQHLVQFFPCIFNPLSVIAVHNIYQSIGALVVVPPQRTDFRLTTHVPHCEADVLVLDGLHIEANCRDCCHRFTQLELVKDGRFSSSIQTYHENAHVGFPRKAVPECGEHQTHLGEKK